MNPNYYLKLQTYQLANYFVLKAFLDVKLSFSCKIMTSVQTKILKCKKFCFFI